MRVLFIGSVLFSKHLLNVLIESGVNIVGVCTLEKSTFNSDHVDLSGVAVSSGIPYRYTPDINSHDAVEWIAELEPDVIYCLGWSRILEAPLLNLPKYGAVGYHPAALPANRGRHPIIWTLVLGLSETASTFFQMGREADNGDILSQVTVPVLHTDTASTLYERLKLVAATQILELTRLFECGAVHRTPQDSLASNNWRKRTDLDGKIDWRMSAKHIDQLIRALSFPYPGAYFQHDHRRITVWEAEPLEFPQENIEPGKIVRITDKYPIVKAGANAIRLISWDPPAIFTEGQYL